MFIKGKFRIPPDWPEKARRDIVEICKHSVDGVPDTVFWAEGCVCLDGGIYCDVVEDGRDVYLTDNGENFPLDNLCVLLQAVMRHYEIPGVAVVTTAGTPESDDESPDGLITVVSPRGTTNLSTTAFQNITNPAEVGRVLSCFVAGLSRMPEFAGFPMLDMDVIEKQQARMRDKTHEVLLTRLDDGEIALYCAVNGKMGEDTIELSLRTDAASNEILTEALQRIDKRWPSDPADDCRLRIFDNGFPYAARDMVEQASVRNWEAVLDHAGPKPGAAC